MCVCRQNLDHWKSSRRKRQEDVIERLTEVKKMEEDVGGSRRRNKTFGEMMQDRSGSVRHGMRGEDREERGEREREGERNGTAAFRSASMKHPCLIDRRRLEMDGEPSVTRQIPYYCDLLNSKNMLCFSYLFSRQFYQFFHSVHDVMSYHLMSYLYIISLP